MKIGSVATSGKDLIAWHSQLGLCIDVFSPSGWNGYLILSIVYRGLGEEIRLDKTVKYLLRCSGKYAHSIARGMCYKPRTYSIRYIEIPGLERVRLGPREILSHHL